MSRVHMDREWLAVHAAPAIVRLHEWQHCGRTARPGHREGGRLVIAAVYELAMFRL